MEAKQNQTIYTYSLYESSFVVSSSFKRDTSVDKFFIISFSESKVASLVISRSDWTTCNFLKIKMGKRIWEESKTVIMVVTTCYNFQLHWIDANKKITMTSITFNHNCVLCHVTENDVIGE